MTRHDPPGSQPPLPSTAAVVSQLPSPVVLLEETGRILMVNAAAATAFGDTEENLTGRLMVDTPLPSALGADARDLVAKAEGRFPGAIYHERSGTIYRFTASIVDPARPCRVIGLFGRDITSLHGEGAPSGSALASLEENLGQLIEDTELAAKRIAAIVGNLNDFYHRSETRDMVAISLNAAVENALRLAGASLRKAGVGIEVSLDPDLPEMIGNPQSVEQICLNILLNAVEAIDHTEGLIDVRTGRSTDGRIFFLIADNGKGISPGIAPTIFDPFVTDKQAYGSTGLGLSVSYSLVQAHRGEIQAAERSGGGSVFTVHFPTMGQFRSAKVMLIDDATP